MSDTSTFPNESETSQDELAELLAAELINPLYCSDTRRSCSVVREEYIPFLDDWFDPDYSRENYPLNSRGSLSRIDSEAVEYFVNILLLDDVMRQQARNRELTAALMEIENSRGITVIRDIYRDALKIVGKRDYEVEWNHESTRVRYSELEIANSGYAEGNIRIAGEIESSILERLRTGNSGEIVILDAGVGNGGTTIPIVRKLLRLVESGLLKREQMNEIQMLLFDTDENKTYFLKTRIPLDMGFPGENIISVHGEFSQLQEVLKEYQGRVTFIVSGAAICHVTGKRDFFLQACSMLNDNGSLHIWDPLEPLLFAPRLRVTGDSSRYYTRRIKITSGNGKGKKFILPSHESLPEEALNYQKEGCRIEIVGEIPAEDALRFCGTTGFQYLPQLGFTSDSIGEKQAMQICRDAYEFLMEGIFSKSGVGFFDFIKWIHKHCRELPAPEKSRSPYQLIEAVEDSEAYVYYLDQAGFSDIQCSYFSQALDYRKSGEIASASSAAMGYIRARKIRKK